MVFYVLASLTTSPGHSRLKEFTASALNFAVTMLSVKLVMWLALKERKSLLEKKEKGK
jgi:hypothetical protein